MSLTINTHSETKCIQIQTSMYICPAAVQQQWRSTAAVGAPPVQLPPGQQALRKAEGVWLLLSMAVFFALKVTQSLQHNT